MFLIDPNRGVPGGAVYTCPYMGRTFFKNSYYALYLAVLKERRRFGHPTDKLHDEIQQYICKSIPPNERRNFCGPRKGSRDRPRHKEVHKRRGCCGGGQIK